MNPKTDHKQHHPPGVWESSAMLLSLPRQVVLLFLLLCFGRFVPQPGSDQKSDGNAGQKTERIHADILNHSGAARDKELVEFISARIGGTGHSADQCFLHKLFGPACFACAAKQMDGDGGADTESTVNINMCPLANVGIVVLAAEPLGGQAVSRGGFHFFRYLLAEGRGALPRLGGKQKDCRHDGQCNAQHHRAHKFQLIVLLRHSRTSAFHRAIMYNTHGILEKHTSFAVQNQAKKRHIRMDCTMLYLFYLSLYYFCSYWLQNRKKGRSPYGLRPYILLYAVRLYCFYHRASMRIRCTYYDHFRLCM